MRKSKKISQKRINEIVADVGKDYYVKVTVKLARYDLLKITWNRGEFWVEFKASDYIKYIPEESIRQLFANLVTHLYGKKKAMMFDANMFSKELAANGHLDTLRKVFLRRKRVKFVEDATLTEMSGTLVGYGNLPDDNPIVSPCFNLIVLPNSRRGKSVTENAAEVEKCRSS